MRLMKNKRILGLLLVAALVLYLMNYFILRLMYIELLWTWMSDKRILLKNISSWKDVSYAIPEGLYQEKEIGIFPGNHPEILLEACGKSGIFPYYRAINQARMQLQVKPSRTALIVLHTTEAAAHLNKNQDDLYCKVKNDSSQIVNADIVLFERREDISPIKPDGSFWLKYDWEIDYRSNIGLPAPLYGIYISYNKPECLTSSENMAKIKSNSWIEQMPKGFWQRENKAVALISNPFDRNSRVEIYGRIDEAVPCPNDTDCLESITSKAKFILSFENSNCREYITEKLFRNAYKTGTIPIVLGAPLEDYQRIAPPNSFIHVDQFNSFKDLADYLYKISTDQKEASKFFAWQTFGSIKTLGDLYYPLRQLCIMHHSNLLKNEYKIDLLTEDVCGKQSNLAHSIF